MSTPALGEDALAETLNRAREVGHNLAADPPYPLSTVVRYTCKGCGRAVLWNTSGTVWGSAASTPCTVLRVGEGAGN